MISTTAFGTKKHGDCIDSEYLNARARIADEVVKQIVLFHWWIMNVDSTAAHTHERQNE